MSGYHQPVLLSESIEGLAINADGVYLDLTFGGGGHSAAILQKLSAKGRLIGFDQDAEAVANMPNDVRFLPAYSNFRYLKNFIEYHKFDGVDGILADLGVSSHHFDTADRGFSTRFDGELDMRMNQQTGISAATMVNSYTEEQLADIFFYYGEIQNARKLASVIVAQRAVAPITTTAQLVAAVNSCTPYKNQAQYSAKAFQALRLEVNKELDVLKEALLDGLEVLKPGGRLVVISYHSLEDRLVKNFFKSGNFEGKIDKDFFGNVNTPWDMISRKAIVPGEKELLENNRARSAKLRIAQKR